MAEVDGFTEQSRIHGSLGQNTPENPSAKSKHLLVTPDTATILSHKSVGRVIRRDKVVYRQSKSLQRPPSSSSRNLKLLYAQMLPWRDGSHVGTHKMYGSWSQQEACLHINVLEMKAVINALKSLNPPRDSVILLEVSQQFSGRICEQTRGNQVCQF